MHMDVHMHIARLWREMAAVGRIDIPDKLGSPRRNVNAKPTSRRVMGTMRPRWDSALLQVRQQIRDGVLLRIGQPQHPAERPGDVLGPRLDVARARLDAGGPGDG